MNMVMLIPSVKVIGGGAPVRGPVMRTLISGIKALIKETSKVVSSFLLCQDTARRCYL